MPTSGELDDDGTERPRRPTCPSREGRALLTAPYSEIVALLTSRYAVYAAVLLAIVMAVAIIAHVTVLGSSPAAPLVLFVLNGIIAYLRKPQNISRQRTMT